MVKLELELTEIDYNYLLQEYLPKVQEKLQQSGSPLGSMLSGGFAGGMLNLMPNSMKDRLAAELINANAARLTEELENIAAKNGIPGKVKNFRATAKDDE